MIDQPHFYLRHLGLVDYVSTWQAMQQFTSEREITTLDELWICEHPAVYTLGQAGKREHVIQAGDIPLVQSDRGGQVTFHGPGQVIVYVLVDLRRAGYGVRELVTRLEKGTIRFLSELDIEASRRPDAPGVYVQEEKIAALGLRVRRGCSYHGIALNIDVDLKPFDGINPCGYSNMKVTSLEQLSIATDKQDLVNTYVQTLADSLVGEPARNRKLPLR